MLASLDHRLFDVLNRGAANPVFDWLMPRLTNLHHQGWFAVLLVALCLVVLWRGDRRARVWVVCAIVAVGLSDASAARLVKRIVPRARPCYAAAAGAPMSFPSTRLVGTCPGSASFPSNHAANMMAVGVVGWWFTRRRSRWLWFLLPLVIGYSRIYLGYHYPSDVLAGWVLGTVMALVCIAVARRLLPREPARHERPPREVVATK